MNYEYLMKDTEQSILETLKNHEDRINENTENIEDLKDKYNDMKDKVESQQKLIEALLRAQNIEPDKFIVQIKIMQYKINKAGQN